MRIYKIILYYTLLFSSLFNLVYSHDTIKSNQNVSTEKKIFYLEIKPIHYILPIQNSTEPDNPCLCYTYQLSNLLFSIGQEFNIINITTNLFKINLTLGGMLVIHNYSSNLKYPSELWRGILFFQSYVEINQKYLRLPPKHRIWFLFSFYHESNHVTNIQSYLVKYLISNNFPDILFLNGSFRSFEIIKNKAIYQYSNKVHTILTSIGYKYYFTILINIRLNQYLLFGIFVEFQYSYEILQTVIISISLYHEYTLADFTTLRNSYNFSFSDNALLTNNLELSVELSPLLKTKIILYIAYEYSNGLGLIFFERNSGFSTGIRLFL